MTDKSFVPAEYKVLIVEDSQLQAEMLLRILHGAGYQVISAKNGTEGLALTQQEKPDIILTDIVMPVMDGFQMCTAIRNNPAISNVPVIMLSALTDVKDVINALNSGADNYLVKDYRPATLLTYVKLGLRSPIDRMEEKKNFLVTMPDDSSYEVKASTSQSLRLLVSIYDNAIEQYRELTCVQAEVLRLNAALTDTVKIKSDQLQLSEIQLRKTLVDLINAIASTVEMRDPYTAGHQRNVARIASLIAHELGMSEDQIFGLNLAGIVHDVGKIDTPAEILNKPGKLRKNEYALVQEHVTAGYNTLKNIDFPWPIAEMVHQHHERLDGSGYPNHLQGDAILLEAKILMVADVVDAISSHRPYRASLGLNFAREELLNNRGSLYAPEVVDACLKLIDQNRLPGYINDRPKNATDNLTIRVAGDAETN